MRKIALDIETTGLNFLEGHKIVEIGCVELIENFPTGKVWQNYINPGRAMPQEAYEVHGLSSDFLLDKPRFSEIVEDFISFIKDSDLIIHNAKFDLTFLNYELESINKKKINRNEVNIIDTIEIAKKLFPGQSVSLDALCKRYKIDLDRRKVHGALLDAELLAEVFLEMHGGRQQNIVLSTKEKHLEKHNFSDLKYSKKIYKLKEDELKKHKELLDTINNF